VGAAAPVSRHLRCWAPLAIVERKCLRMRASVVHQAPPCPPSPACVGRQEAPSRSNALVRLGTSILHAVARPGTCEVRVMRPQSVRASGGHAHYVVHPPVRRRVLTARRSIFKPPARSGHGNVAASDGGRKQLAFTRRCCASGTVAASAPTVCRWRRVCQRLVTVVGLGRTQGLLAMHDATSTPWWLTIVGTTVLLRTALLPITLRGMRAAAENQPLIAHCFGLCCSRNFSGFCCQRNALIFSTVTASPTEEPAGVCGVLQE
jgi:hypothetical protein